MTIIRQTNSKDVVVDNKELTAIIKKTDQGMTLKQRKWLQRYLETGNATQAAMFAYDCKSLATASSLGVETKKALGVTTRMVMEAQGLDLGSIIKTVQDATKAKKHEATDNGLIEVEDHTTRLRAVDIAGKWLGADDRPTQAQNPVNVQFNNIIGGVKKDIDI